MHSDRKSGLQQVAKSSSLIQGPRDLLLAIVRTRAMSSRWDSPPQAPSAEASAASSSAVAAAAAAAAKIAAQFAPPRPSASTSKDDERSASATDAKDLHDAEFTHDIEINDQRNRYMLTNGPAQQQMHKETGASITTKGTWYPDKSLATKEDPPLYLHISANSKEMLDAAISKVNDLINQDLPQLVEDRNQRRADYENQRPPPRERKRWPEEKLPINLESVRNFHIRSKVVGPGGMFVKYIQSETGTRVQIKGIGSGFIESETGTELPEPMHISIAGPDEEQIKAAKLLAEDLLEVVRFEWQKAVDALNAGFGGQQSGQNFGGGGRGGYSGYAQPHHEQQYHHQQQYQQPAWNTPSVQAYHHGHTQPPTPGGEPPPPPPPEDDAPPPPPSDYNRPVHDSRSSNGPRSDNVRRQDPAAHRNLPLSPARTAATPTAQNVTPEQAALDKYWRDYVTWEDSFRAYHHRRPTKEEGLQDVPPSYRTQ